MRISSRLTHTSHTHRPPCDLSGSDLMMESAVRRSLLAPIRTLKLCVTGEKKPPAWNKHRDKRGSKVRRCDPCMNRMPDPPLLRAYHADLERERKCREAMNAQKNAERAEMRAHFRRKYQLTENVQDSKRLRAAGGKVLLPRDLAQMVSPETPSRDDGFSLLAALQGLSFTGSKQTKTPSTANTEQCKVM